MISAAIVGLGWWGQNLVNSVRQSDSIRFVAAHTRTESTAAAVCQQHGLRWTADLGQILGDPAIDAVVFATPHSQHVEQVRRAAAAGKAIFVEKPLALTVADGRAMLDAAKAAGVVLAIGFNRRFHPSMAMLRQAVRTGRLGIPVTISAEQTAVHGLTLAADAWRAQPDESPGGAMTPIGVHLVDGMIDLLGPITEVYARVSRHAGTVADNTTDVLLSFAGGATGHIFCSTVAAPGYRMAIHGTSGFAEVLGSAMDIFRLVAAAGGAPEVTQTPGFNMLTAELEAFAASIAARQPFPTPLTEVLHGVEVFEAILRSAASGRPERVDPGE